MQTTLTPDPGVAAKAVARNEPIETGNDLAAWVAAMEGRGLGFAQISAGKARARPRGQRSQERK